MVGESDRKNRKSQEARGMRTTDVIYKMHDPVEDPASGKLG
jgi:hypothetical protein